MATDFSIAYYTPLFFKYSLGVGLTSVVTVTLKSLLSPVPSAPFKDPFFPFLEPWIRGQRDDRFNQFNPFSSSLERGPGV